MVDVGDGFWEKGPAESTTIIIAVILIYRTPITMNF